MTTLICLSCNFTPFTELPTPSPQGATNGGGDGIRLGYREGTTGTFTTLTAGQAITLRDGVSYDFECAVLNINSVSPIPTSGAPATGTCPSGTSSIARDLVNIFFYFANNAVDNGQSGNNEPSTYTNPLYSVADTFRRTLNNINDGCPSSLTCRAANSAAGSPAADANASPFITVSINYESKSKFVVVFFSISHELCQVETWFSFTQQKSSCSHCAVTGQ